MRSQNQGSGIRDQGSGIRSQGSGIVRITWIAVRAAIVLTIAFAAVANAQTRQWPTERPPRPLPARAVKFPPYEIRTLPNGLQVVLVSHHEQPAVSVRMTVKAGAAQDPKGKLGVAMLTAALLDQGAAGRNAEQIAEAIDFIGGILGTGAGTDLTYVNAVVMKDNLPFALNLLADVARRPNFAVEEVERQRQQALAGLKVAAEDPDSVAGRVIDRLIYGFHPYGLPGTGTPESLASLTRQDFVDFHRQFYVPNNALLAIVGDVSADEAFAGVQKAFGDWERRDVPVFKPIDPPQPTRRVVVIDKPDSVQTEIRVGQIGIPRKHNEFLALDQAVKILGGEGANRLQQVLRSQRGLTYGASAELETYKAAGGIVAETDTRTDATAEALRIVVDEFVKLQRERVYEGELEGAQAYLAGHFPLTIETPDAIATQVLYQLFYELPLEELETYPDRVRKVTPDDVQRVARGFFRPDRLAIVLVGNASAFMKDLAGVGFTDVERIRIEQVDLLAADLKKSSRGVQGSRVPGFRGSGFRGSGFQTENFRTANFELRTSKLGTSNFGTSNFGTSELRNRQDTQASELIARAVEAHGGLEALKSVKTLVADVKTAIMTPQGKVSATATAYMEYPEKMRIEADVPGARIVQVYADGKAWFKDPNGVHEAPPELVKDLRQDLVRDPVSLLLSAVSGKLKSKLEPEAGHEGRVLKVISLEGDGLPSVRVHLDPQSGLIVKIIAASTGPQGAFVAEEMFDDYRVVNGVKFAFKASLSRNGTQVAEREVSELKINVPIAPDMFAKPQ